MTLAAGWLRVRGARTHNLQGFNLELPLGRLIVISGPSGSGKSSLAFDTLHAEGQRRFLQTLPGEARALFEQLPPPDVDAIEGLPPTLCVSQQTSTPRPRSTLATLTEIHDHLRLLWARLGTPHCISCGATVRKHTVSDIVRETLKRGEGCKLYLLAPLVRAEAGDATSSPRPQGEGLGVRVTDYKAILTAMRQGGFLRARIDGALGDLQETPKLSAKTPHTIELVVDRLALRSGIEDRLTESLHTTLKHGNGRVIVTEQVGDGWRDAAFSTVLVCPQCQLEFPDLTPRLFSFNDPRGACPRCTGFGRVLPSPPGGRGVGGEGAARGPDDEETLDAIDDSSEFVTCPDCRGARLCEAARAVRLAEKGLHEVVALTVAEAAQVFAGWKILEVAPGLERVRDILVHEIEQRLHFLCEVGLDYLTLDRPAPTLSGGELQRARLASHLGGGLLGVCYILDEPTKGLHPRDTVRLLQALADLRDRGNTLIVVEHDETVVRGADWLVDMGPGAGRLGGKVLASGTVEDVLKNPESVTACFLRPQAATVGQDSAPVQTGGQERNPIPQEIIIHGARQHNLKYITVRIPLGRLVALAGVSGSGKSTLARDILAHAARRRLGLVAPTPGAHERIDGLEHIDKFLEVNQKPLGQSARSTPATYTGALDEIRKLFAATKIAKARGYKANRFSFNVRGGRCEDCKGQGTRQPAAAWLPELVVPCPVCQGQRYNRATLEVRYKNLSIADVLALPIDEARTFFANIPTLHRILETLAEVGLGYLSLGQPADTLSGGEAQRVKLSAELAKTATGKSLFLLDEPTTGLHFADIVHLVKLLRRLVAAGNTVLVIEHHPDVIAAADWVIDLGPGAGDAGGNVVVAGSPRVVSECVESHTGRFLRGEAGA
ncbi:MAG: ATP-binding cassette domain-containing protein [Gemmataceae bacterium]|nr:ATP-binding cassette domain-containing protein [Gemmataceae bacterium]MCI0742842.1 ATP-binding cassette domain-containing protein [Gemmataceae bacterium]